MTGEVTMQKKKMDIQTAAELYRDRQDRASHPAGKMDKKGRWYPADSEWQTCCGAVRSPSRAFPWSYMTHCRTTTHIARLCGVDEKELRRAVRTDRPARREGGDSYYKQVAVIDGRLLSIFDGQTEYVLGQEMRELARQDHEGGYYVYPSIVEARQAKFPENARLAEAPKVIVRVRAEGQYCRYASGKLAFSRIVPLEIVEELR